MLKRVSEALNKNVEYVKEMHTRYFIFDDIQYLLKDEDNKEYLLVLCFDDNERQQPGEIWSKKVDRLMYRLYEYPIINGHKVKNKVLKYNIICEEIEKSNYRDEFSLNRFEIIYPNNKNYVLRYNDEALMLSIDGFKAKVGTWNNFTKRTTFLAMINYVFKTFKNVKEIEYENLIYNCQFDNHYWRHPDFYLPLPEDKESLLLNISYNSRRNIIREREKIFTNFSNVSFFNIPFIDVQRDIIDFYYKNKNESYGCNPNYNLFDRNITDVYCLKANKQILAVLFNCEQSGIAYGEATTYDLNNKKYSLGKAIYVLTLQKIIEKKIKGISLGSSAFNYKRHFGSICYNTYSGTIKRTLYVNYKRLLFNKYNVDNWFYHKYMMLIYLLKK